MQDDWKENSHTTSSSEPSMLTMLWCELGSIIQMQCTFWGHEVTLRDDNNLAESSVCPHFVARHVSLCWGSSKAEKVLVPTGLCHHNKINNLQRSSLVWEAERKAATMV